MEHKRWNILFISVELSQSLQVSKGSFHGLIKVIGERIVMLVAMEKLHAMVDVQISCIRLARGLMDWQLAGILGKSQKEGLPYWAPLCDSVFAHFLGN